MRTLFSFVILSSFNRLKKIKICQIVITLFSQSSDFTIYPKNCYNEVSVYISFEFLNMCHATERHFRTKFDFRQLWETYRNSRHRFRWIEDSLCDTFVGKPSHWWPREVKTNVEIQLWIQTRMSEQKFQTWFRVYSLLMCHYLCTRPETLDPVHLHNQFHHVITCHHLSSSPVFITCLHHLSSSPVVHHLSSLPVFENSILIPTNFIPFWSPQIHSHKLHPQTCF